MTNANGQNASLKMAQGIVRSFRQHSPDAGILRSFADDEQATGTRDGSIEIIVTSGDENLAVKHRFEEPFVLIGRSPECDLSLADDHVSSRHAYLQRIFGHVVCVDLASSNGTYWPDGRRPFGWFDEERPISIGKYQLRLTSESPAEPLANPEFDPESFFKTESVTPEVPKVALQFLTASGDEECWTLNRTITLVGASSCCKLRLQHKSVSRVHSSLLLLPEGLWVVDLLGNGGTLVNDKRIRSLRLSDGDVFKVGKYAFRVKYLPPEQKTANSNAIIHDHALAGKVISNEFAGQLIEQVATMQRQFLQHSQQQTEMMLRFFSALHTQQHELLSQELARVREIDRELRELRGALLRQQESRGPDSADGDAEALGKSRPNSPPRLNHIRTVGPPVDQSVSEPRTSESDGNAVEADTDQPSDLENSITDDDLAAVQQSSAANDDGEAANEVVAESVHFAEFKEESPQPEAGEVEHPDEEEFRQDSPGPESGEFSGIDHHAWIMSRMYQLESERDGIFRKMMNAIFKPNS